MRRSTAIFTLNRGRVPLAFQADHAGSIPVTRSTENPCTARVSRGSDLFKAHPFGANAPISDIESVLKRSVDAMFDDLVWWSTTLRTARTAA
jgi:hypothetical protein